MEPNHEHLPSGLPKNFRLLEGETLLEVKHFDYLTPAQKPSSLKEMYRLTSASSEDEVGERGPAIAALPYEHSQADPEHQGLYKVVFGRDSLRVAIDLVKHYPKLAASTVLEMARLQGTARQTRSEEEPGRIVHEARDPHDPIAREITDRLGWEWPFYGSVDATPEFIRTMAAYYNLEDDNHGFLFQSFENKDGQPRIMADALTAAVEWINKRLDDNPEGLLEYKPAFAGSIENQVWKDSWDAYHHADGTLANHEGGIASIEVQTVTHEALLDAANMYEQTLGKKDEAAALRARAGKLRQAILDHFWTEDKGGYFVLGTDRDENGQLRQMKVRTSNMGHVLNSSILDEDTPENIRMRKAIYNQLCSPELLSAAGVQTLASDEKRYRPGAYHNGSVWIWDTHHIAKGLRRFADRHPEFGELADELDRRILDVINTIGGFPEYVRGGDTIAINTDIIDVRDQSAEGRINRIEQPPQEVQAWTVAAILATKRRRGRRGLIV